jgi:hypothetical protein
MKYELLPFLGKNPEEEKSQRDFEECRSEDVEDFR